MDKIVDGNVFIIAEKAEITGQINGNLFVCANNVKFGLTEEEEQARGIKSSCRIMNSIFVCANSIYYNAGCNDLYAISSNDIEMTYDSFVIRDLKALSSNIKIKSAIGRNADLSFNKIDLGESSDIPIIYGNLSYSAPSEVTIPEGVITQTGTTTYNGSSYQGTSNISVVEILINFLVCIITTVIIFALIKKFIPKFSEKLDNEKLDASKLLKCFGIGLLSIVTIIILFILLVITQVGIKLGFILVLLFIALCLISTPILAIIITNILKPILKLDKKSIFYLILCLVSIVLYGITLLPYVGGLFSLLIAPTSIGLLINMILPKKELTDEEKEALTEAKIQAKEDKEKRRQEKAEAKALRKEQKLENKKNKTE